MTATSMECVKQYTINFALILIILVLVSTKVSSLPQSSNSPKQSLIVTPIDDLDLNHQRLQELKHFHVSHDVSHSNNHKRSKNPSIHKKNVNSFSDLNFILDSSSYFVRSLGNNNAPKYSDFLNLTILSTGSDSTRVGAGASVQMLNPASNLPRTEKFPVNNPYQLPSGSHSDIPSIQASFSNSLTSDEKTTNAQRLQKIRNVFLTSWGLYKKHAWGADEIRPVSQSGINPFTGWGATLIDGLDTIIIMGLDSEFREAVNYIDSVDFDTTFRSTIPMFETVIRFLGGLISAYDLSNQSEPVLLAKAIQLGDNLIGAFDTPNRMPRLHFKWQDTDWKFREMSGTSSSIAEIASMSMEFTRLAQLTGNSSYFDAVHRVSIALSETATSLNKPYLFPGVIDSSGCSVVAIDSQKLPSLAYGDENKVKAAEQSASRVGDSSSLDSPFMGSTSSGNPSSSSDSKTVSKSMPTFSSEKHTSISESNNPNSRSSTTTLSPASHETHNVYTAMVSDTSHPYGIVKSSFNKPSSSISTPTYSDPSLLSTANSPLSSPIIIYDTYLSSFLFSSVYSSPGGTPTTYTTRSTYTKYIAKTTQFVVLQSTDNNDHPQSFSKAAPSSPLSSESTNPKSNPIDPSKQAQNKLKARNEQESYTFYETKTPVYVRDYRIIESEKYPDKFGKRQTSGKFRNIISVFNDGESIITGCEERGIYAGDYLSKTRIGIGGGTDSAYEYYVKEYALLNGGSPLYQDLYENTIDAATENFMYKPLVEGDPDILFMGSLLYQGNNFWRYDNSMSHLTCFVGGMYALGSKVFNRPSDLDLARKLTDGCVWAYNITDTGVMPEWFSVRRCPSAPPSGGPQPDCHFDTSTADQMSHKENQNLLAKLHSKGITTENFDASLQVTDNGSDDGAHNKPSSFLQIAPDYALRPEALESVFYMYRITGEREWQEKAWKMVESILQLTGVPDVSGNIIGYSGVSDVTDNRRQGVHNTTSSSLFLDYCESFWYAETLKYAYLIFTEPDVVSLDNYVFNTEGHPFQRPN